MVRRIAYSSRARRSATASWLFLGGIGLIAACSTDSERGGVDVASSELTQEQQLILGFERPTTDWSAPNGTLSSSTIVTQGTRSLAVSPVGWTEITCIPLSSLGAVQSSLRVDV